MNKVPKLGGAYSKINTVYKKDFMITQVLLSDLEHTADIMGIDKRVIIAEENDTYAKKTLQNIVKLKSFEYFFEEDYRDLDVCNQLKEKGLYIPNEGHPTECFNKKLSVLILDLLQVSK